MLQQDFICVRTEVGHDERAAVVRRGDDLAPGVHDGAVAPSHVLGLQVPRRRDGGDVELVVQGAERKWEEARECQRGVECGVTLLPGALQQLPVGWPRGHVEGAGVANELGRSKVGVERARG